MPTVPLATPRTRRLISWRVRKLLIGYSYLVPAALCMLATVVVPIILAIKMSLYADVLYKPQDYRFIGLGNYVRLVQDPVFWLTLWNSVVWVFGSVILQFVFGFAAALLLQQAFRGRALVRTLTLLPWIIPGVVVGLIWEWLYQPNYGVINDLLIRVGWMHERIAWLSSPDTAMAAGVFTNVWRGIPFFAIMLLACLPPVPGELYEAAHVDGPGALPRFWHLTSPPHPTRWRDHHEPAPRSRGPLGAIVGRPGCVDRPRDAYRFCARAVHLDAADIPERPAGTLRAAAAVPAGAPHLRELYRCLDLAC